MAFVSQSTPHNELKLAMVERAISTFFKDLTRPCESFETQAATNIASFAILVTQHLTIY